MKRVLLLALTWLSVVIAPLAHATNLQAGKHYTVVNPPQPTQSPGKIEVLEFFSYACVHCADFHPIISQWAAKLPKDVSFRRVHVTFNRPVMARLAKAFYAAEATGTLATIDHDLFKAIHEQRMNFNADEDLIKWVAGKGVDGKKFADAMNGFSINSLVQRGDNEATAFKVPGTPAIVVDGRYLVNNSAAESYGDLLRMTDALVAQVRKEKGKK